MIFNIFQILLLIFFIISLFFNYKFSKIILNIQDSVQQSVDIIDEKYRIIDEISKTSLAEDSQEVRDVHNSIKDVRDSIHEIALILTKDFSKEDQGDQEEEELREDS